MVKKNKKISLLAVLAVVIAGILSIPAFFYWTGKVPVNTTVNGMDMSLKSPEEICKALEEKVPETTITIMNKEDTVAELKSSEFVSFHFDKTAAEQLSSLQAHYEAAMFVEREITIPIKYNVNGEKLNTILESLNGKESSENAYLTYDETKKKYIIIPEKEGNIFDKEDAAALIISAAKTQEDAVVDISSAFITAGVISGNKELVETEKELNNLLSSSVTYSVDNNSTLLNADTYFEWIEKDSKGIPYIDEFGYAIKDSVVEEYVLSLCELYEKPMESEEGEVLERKIDKDRERDQLKKDIISGEKIRREPVWQKIKENPSEDTQ